MASPTQGEIHVRGVVQIFRFNWPFHAAAAVVLAAIELGMRPVPIPSTTRVLFQTVTGLMAFWMVASVAGVMDHL